MTSPTTTPCPYTSKIGASLPYPTQFEGPTPAQSTIYLIGIQKN